MTITKTNIIAFVAALALLAALWFVLREPMPVQGSSFPSAPTLTVATTTTSVSLTTSARLLATTSNPVGTPGVTSFTRAAASICTASSNPVYINLDGDKAAGIGKVTAIIAAAAGYNACFFLTDEFGTYNGSITASSTNETATVVSVKEYVY